MTAPKGWHGPPSLLKCGHACAQVPMAPHLPKQAEIGEQCGVKVVSYLRQQPLSCHYTQTLQNVAAGASPTA